MSEPTTKELLDRIAGLEERLLAAQKAICDLYDERNNCFQVHEVQYNRMMAVFERLIVLEGKVFPNMWPMLGRVEKVVGNLDEAHRHNPLDQRKKGI